MRAVLIVNPQATSTTRLRRDVIASALASAVKLDVVQTRYRGHAARLAATARREGCELVLTLGGDGTVNEAVNGILADGGTAAELPALAALPGGSANVFTRSLGLPRDPVDAAGHVLQALADRRERTIGLGLAEELPSGSSGGSRGVSPRGGRYFASNAGLGLDAEVVRAVQGMRADGRAATPSFWVRLTLRQFYRGTDRKQPAITVELDAGVHGEPVFLTIISNTAPWTYLGDREVHASPRASLDADLDVFALRSLSSVATFSAVRQMLRTNAGGRLRGKQILSWHDQPSVHLTSPRPVAFQIDGEYAGERQTVSCRSVRNALRIVV